MPWQLAEAAALSSLCREFGFRTVGELEAAWSRACLIVMAEAMFHANYTPPRDDEPEEGGDVDLISAFNIPRVQV